jgi:hypothetical protein
VEPFLKTPKRREEVAGLVCQVPDSVESGLQGQPDREKEGDPHEYIY